VIQHSHKRLSRFVEVVTLRALSRVREKRARRFQRPSNIIPSPGIFLQQLRDCTATVFGMGVSAWPISNATERVCFTTHGFSLATRHRASNTPTGPNGHSVPSLACACYDALRLAAGFPDSFFTSLPLSEPVIGNSISPWPATRFLLGFDFPLSAPNDFRNASIRSTTF